MAVYIPGMEMPPRCGRCDMRVAMYDDGEFDHYECCIVAAIIDNMGERLPDCPVVPVPPHGRLGDLDKLEQMFVDIDNAPYSGFDGSEPFYSAEDAAQIIRLSPTIIPANDKDICVPIKEEGEA